MNEQEPQQPQNEVPAKGEVRQGQQEEQNIQMEPTPLSEPPSHKKLIIGIVVVFVLVVAGIAGAYFVFLPKIDTGPLACTADAKICPDGSSVGRTGPNCEFAECPSKEINDTSKSVDSPRIINCNPRDYYNFEQFKPCISDMTSVNIERENKALAVVRKVLSENPAIIHSFLSANNNESDDFTNGILLVSDKRYQLLELGRATLGYVVVDIVEEELTDYFELHSFIVGPRKHTEAQSSDKFIFLDIITSQQTRIGMMVRQYELGKKKSFSLQESEVYYPETYFGSENSALVGHTNILASTTNSITLGIYNRDKEVSQEPSEYVIDNTVYEQVGKKVINFPD